MNVITPLRSSRGKPPRLPRVLDHTSRITGRLARQSRRNHNLSHISPISPGDRRPWGAIIGVLVVLGTAGLGVLLAILPSSGQPAFGPSPATVPSPPGPSPHPAPAIPAPPSTTIPVIPKEEVSIPSRSVARETPKKAGRPVGERRQATERHPGAARRPGPTPEASRRPTPRPAPRPAPPRDGTPPRESVKNGKDRTPAPATPEAPERPARPDPCASFPDFRRDYCYRVLRDLADD